MANIDDFQKLDIRVGKITEVEDFPEAYKPFTSESLTLGVSDEEGRCVLIIPDKNVYLGAKLY